jgi:hypothetical protein
MVSLGISESTFAFAFLNEQIFTNWDQLRAVPIFPTTIREGRPDVGYDVHLQLSQGTDYYYQFKVSEYLKGPNSNYLNVGPGAGPYYRIKLHHKNNNQQHRALRILSQRCRNTYYVAPEFELGAYSDDEITALEYLNRYFRSNTLSDNSRKIPIHECRDFTAEEERKQHYIIYRSGSRAVIKSRSVSPIRKSISEKTMEDFYKEHNGRLEKIDNIFINKRVEIIKKQIKILYPELYERDGKKKFKHQREMLDFNFTSAKKTEVLFRLSQLLNVFFNVTMVIVGKPYRT